MSKEHNEPQTRPKGEHGTTKSYVIGFILSLVFTVLPYYLVVNKTVTGSALLATIFGFAVLQMVVQVLFFLHLGRGPKPLYNVVFFISTIGIIIVVAGGSIFIMSHLHYYMTPSETSKYLAETEGIAQVGGQKTGACQEILTNHKVIISEGKLSPVHSYAKLCDSLTFIMLDDAEREIAFGQYPSQQTYAGKLGVSLQKGRNKTITLNQAGTFMFRDDTDLKLAGDFTVEQ